MADIPPLPPLPMAQQILAWGIRALGHAERGKQEGGVSRQTLKNAARGQVITQSWEQLTTWLLRVAGVELNEERVELFQDLCNEWDRRIGELVAVPELSPAERLQGPLQWAVPHVGARLGAVAALCASRLGGTADSWVELVDIFDDRFFGRLIDALFRFRRPDLATIEQRKRMFEDQLLIDWRTVERWRRGVVDVPGVDNLPAMGEAFGGSSEQLLRAGRLACELREGLRCWIGVEGANDWGRAINLMARDTARLLMRPVVISDLVQFLCGDLAGTAGENLHAILAGMLPKELRALSREKLIERLESSAAALRAADRIDRPIATWVLAMSIVAPDRRLLVQSCEASGSQEMALLAMVDFFVFVQRQWQAFALANAIESGGPLRYEVNGESRVRVVSELGREAARRWKADIPSFTRARESVDDLDGNLMLLEAFGDDARAAFRQFASVPELPFLALTDPKVEVAMPDAVVAKHGALSYARAVRLAEAGQERESMQWFGTGRLVGTGNDVEFGLMVAALTAIGHRRVDRIRQAWRKLPASPTLSERGALVTAMEPLEELLAPFAAAGETSDGGPAPLDVLVSAAQLALRLHFLQVDLESKRSPAIEQVFRQLDEGLVRRPTHGRGWAMSALWHRLHERDDRAADAERKAQHYGAGAFLDAEIWRAEEDAGATDDAGVPEEAG